MDSTQCVGSDRVVVTSDRLIVISSAHMDGWEVRRHRHTLIRFDGRSWRVTGRAAFAKNDIRYELSPWSPDEHELTGPVVDYDLDYVNRRDLAANVRRQRHVTGEMLRVISPAIGFLWARTKGDLEVTYGVDPVASTWHSVLLESVVALMSLMSAAFFGLPFVLIGTILALDAVVRWDRILGEERPPSGFYEWGFRTRSKH